MQISNTS